VQFYVTGQAEFNLTNDSIAKITTTSEYPKEGKFTARFSQVTSNEEFSLLLRVPGWCSRYQVYVNGALASVETKPGTYAVITRKWQEGDCIQVDMDLTVRVFESPHGSNRLGDNHVAVMRGPILLARDRRTQEEISQPVDMKQAVQAGTTYVQLDNSDDIDCIVRVKVSTDSGNKITMIDYFSAGSTWDSKSEFCCWMKLK